MPISKPAWRFSWITTLLIFGLVSAFFVCVGHGQRSAWVTMFLPIRAEESFHTCLGLASLHDGSIVNGENWYTIMNVFFFNGVEGTAAVVGFTLFRGYYPFIASLLSPFVGLFASFLILNWLAWAVCVIATWKLSRKLFHNPWASTFASVLACGGIGMTIHIHDYSPHLLSFASYYWGVYWLYASGVFRRQRPWRTHLFLALYLSMACLTYNTGVMLTAVYAILAVRYNRLRYIIGVAFLALGSRPLWVLFLRWMGASIVDVEKDYLLRSLKAWNAFAHAGLPVLAGRILYYTSEFVTFDFPLTVLLGLYAFFAYKGKPGRRFFGLTVLLIPMAAGMVFAPSAYARGYLIFGISIWIYCWEGRLLASIFEKQTLGTAGSIAVIGLLLLAPLAWSSAHLYGQSGPARIYFEGWDHGWSVLLHPPARAYSMTGHEAVPILYGGTGTINEAGGFIAPRTLSSRHLLFSLRESGLHKLPIFLQLCLCLWIWIPSRTHSEKTLLGILCLFLISIVMTSKGIPGVPGRFIVGHNLMLPTNAELDYELRVSSTFQDLLVRSSSNPVFLAFVVPEEEVNSNFSVSAGTIPIECVTDVARFGPQLFLAKNPRSAISALTTQGRLSFRLKNALGHDIYLSGWQRPDLMDRRLRSTQDLRAPGFPEKRPAVLPAIEIRLYHSDGTLALCGY